MIDVANATPEEILAHATPEEVLEYISDGSGRPVKIVETPPEEIRDSNIRLALIYRVNELVEYYNVSEEHVLKIAKEL